jgi:hypothetical protein
VVPAVVLAVMLRQALVPEHLARVTLAVKKHLAQAVVAVALVLLAQMLHPTRQVTAVLV